MSPPPGLSKIQIFIIRKMQYLDKFSKSLCINVLIQPFSLTVFQACLRETTSFLLHILCPLRTNPGWRERRPASSCQWNPSGGGAAEPLLFPDHPPFLSPDTTLFLSPGLSSHVLTLSHSICCLHTPYLGVSANPTQC